MQVVGLKNNLFNAAFYFFIFNTMNRYVLINNLSAYKRWACDCKWFFQATKYNVLPFYAKW